MGGLNFDFREMNNRRRQMRRPKNIHDKTTIVSIFPKDLSKEFITLENSFYTIKGGTKSKPSLTLIEPTSWWSQNQPPPAPLLEVTVDSFSLANSIVKDTLIGMLNYKEGEASPGIFILPGEVSLIKLTTDYKSEIEKAEKRQIAWYEEMIKMANIDWPKAQGNPLSIHDDSRLAANELGRKDLPWMGQFIQQELIPCAACGAPRNPKYPVCGSCHLVVDKELATKLGIEKAG